MVGSLPGQWTGKGPAIPNDAVIGWLDDFHSAKLSSLVTEAVGNSFDLGATRARVRQLEERAKIAGADRLLTLDSGIGTRRSQNLRGAAFQKTRANNFDFSLDLTWEVDLWGRLKNLQDAELDKLLAETNVYEASRLSLAANVAKTAFEIVESKQQIALSRRNLSSLSTNLKILDDKLEAGDADDRTALDISLSRADQARAKSSILAEQRQLDSAKRTLETLLGRYPAGLIDGVNSLPSIPKRVPAGLPSELMLRRPDLLAAEARVDSALKELSATRKALLPAIRISGGAGTATTDEFADLFNIQNLVWNIAQNLTRPLYQGGRLRANIRLDENELDELAANYAETALTAFREVETALAGEHYLASQHDALAVAARESRRAEQLSLDQYEKGIVDIITLLESQRRSFDAQSTYLALQLQLLTNRVDLYLALGGDFHHPLMVK
jgi:outer membrane protein, multidrug efflux system